MLVRYDFGFLTIVRLPSYERSAKNVLEAAEERWIDITLAADPNAGVVMKETGGVRKLRVARPGRGKSSGARVVYLHTGSLIYLLDVFAKNEKANLTKSEKNTIKQLVAVLKG